MSFDEREYNQIYQRIENRYQKRTGCIKHWFIYFSVIILPFFFLLFENEALLFPLLVIGLFWGLGLIYRSIGVFLETFLWVNSKEKAFQRELEMARWYKEQGQAPLEQQSRAKRKNDKNYQHLQLSYDGELVPTDDFDAEPIDDYLYAGE